MKKGIFALTLVMVSLSACVSSTPVVVNTDKGPITCDLYWRNFVYWDRSISRPNNMTEVEADTICREVDSRN